MRRRNVSAPVHGRGFREHIRGGLASGRRPSDFPQKALKKGIRVELEHVCRRGKKPTPADIHIATEIAMDHLEEHLHYYDELEKMERKLKKRRNPPEYERGFRDGIEFGIQHCGVLAFFKRKALLGRIKKMRADEIKEEIKRIEAQHEGEREGVRAKYRNKKRGKKGGKKRRFSRRDAAAAKRAFLSMR